MRRLFILCCVIGLCWVAWQAYFRRSATIDLTQGYRLTYTVAWGLGMDQRLSLKQYGLPWATGSTGWIEVWNKPYNTGAVVYAAETGDIYYIGTGYQLVAVNVTQGTMLTRCDPAWIPKPTALAEQQMILENNGGQGVSNAPKLWTYLPQNANGGGAPINPPLSEYYVGVRYLGRFGIVEPDRQTGLGRGQEVRFVPAENAPEPRLALRLYCG
ncbi:hypothetical protein [Rhizobium oryzicola]|uniref:Uncharacterized protein n=1 Tax=Rhizobium oryzicola TaxID=1232668 RepID=A0ABT8ST14_9HYPH|nr:hypothetical protein [Rhizobium oryzicola]MDO1581548.1 hypothetical protein [Rhizobium oryzicola]